MKAIFDHSSGITTCGEFHYFHHENEHLQYSLDDVVMEAARDAGIRLVLLNAFYKRLMHFVPLVDGPKFQYVYLDQRRFQQRLGSSPASI